jgi:amino acid transporter
MPLVILSYLLANVAYIFVLPSDTIASSTTIAVQFGSVVFGPVGSLVLALIVSASCFGALNATTFTSGRLVYAAGQEGLLPEFFGRIGMPGTPSPDVGTRMRKRSRAHRLVARVLGDEAGGLGFTPITAMVFNALLSTGYIVVGEFSTLITFYGVAGYTFYFLTVLGLIVLRVREPYLERPYRTWLSTPIIFCCVSLFLLSRAVFKQPVQTLMVVGFVALGVGVYYLRGRGRGRAQGNRGRGGGRGGANGDGPGWRFWRRWGRS